MGLFTPAWKSKNAETALSAVQKASDPKTLANIICNAPLPEVRFAAILKSVNVKGVLELLRVAQHETWEGVFSRCVNGPESFFISVALCENVHIGYRRQAVRKIKTPAAIIAVAKSCNGKSVRLAALEAIKEEALLAAGEAGLLLEKQQEQKQKQEHEERFKAAMEESRRNEGYRDCPHCKAVLSYKGYTSDYGITAEFGYRCFKCGHREIIKKDHVSRL
jgi:hypothetical protein